MQLGIAVRSMGPQSAPGILLACVRAAEEAGVSRVVVGTRYADADEFSRQVDAVAERVLPALPGMRRGVGG
jgi:hypothetical protein